VLARGSDLVPLVGARRLDQLTEAVKAQEFAPTADDLAAIERAVPLRAAAGDRYHAHGMAGLDSERDDRRQPGEHAVAPAGPPRRH
jgi:hypothetical protein